MYLPQKRKRYQRSSTFLLPFFLNYAQFVLDRLESQVIDHTASSSYISRHNISFPLQFSFFFRPTPISWSAAASDSMPTRFPLRPYPTMSPTYTTAITIIDQISYKIMRTTELVSDILKNTVRAVVGRQCRRQWTSSNYFKFRFNLQDDKDEFAMTRVES